MTETGRSRNLAQSDDDAPRFLVIADEECAAPLVKAVTARGHRVAVAANDEQVAALCAEFKPTIGFIDLDRDTGKGLDFKAFQLAKQYRLAIIAIAG